MLDGTPMLDIKPYVPQLDDRADPGSAGTRAGSSACTTSARTSVSADDGNRRRRGYEAVDAEVGTQ